jgi:hypothetical protein
MKSEIFKTSIQLLKNELDEILILCVGYMFHDQVNSFL